MPKVTILEKTLSPKGDSLFVRIKFEDGEEAGFNVGTPETEKDFENILKGQVRDHEKSKADKLAGKGIKEADIKSEYTW